MSTYAAYPRHSFPRNWSALDLADAMPLRLSERITLGLVDFSVAPAATNNPFAAAGTRGWHHGYTARAEHSAFRVR